MRFAPQRFHPGRKTVPNGPSRKIKVDAAPARLPAETRNAWEVWESPVERRGEVRNSTFRAANC